MDFAGFLGGLPLLTARDRRGVLALLAKILELGKRRRDSGKLHTVCTVSGISIYRNSKNDGSRIYRVSGIGEVPHSAETAFELLCNIDLIPEWDMIFKGAKYLTFTSAPGCEVAHLRVVYGLPGVSRLVSDRDFILRTVRVYFPNGVRVLYCHSVGPEELGHLGNPLPGPRVVRGHMWHSGYVVAPARGGDSCCMSITLQVDPKGWIPTSVVNVSLEAIPLNIQRIRAALQRLPGPLLERLAALNAAQPARCKAAPVPAALLGGTPTGAKAVRRSISTGSAASDVSGLIGASQGDGGCGSGSGEEEEAEQEAVGGVAEHPKRLKVA